MLKVTIAYGIPASGKTTLLKTLKGKYYDFDTPENRFKVKEFINSLKDGDIIIDFLLRDINDFISYFFKRFPNAKLIIYRFSINRRLCLSRDKNRRNKDCKDLIKIMKLEKINKKHYKNLEVIKCLTK